MQRTRSSVFETIKDLIDGAVFFDLFAAAGGMGIEALSRGARLAHFVENHPTALALLRANLSACGIVEASYRIHPADALGFVEAGGLGERNGAIVFADPPYGGDIIPSLLANFERMAYDQAQLIVMEHRGRIDLAPFPGLSLEKEKVFGETRVTYLVPTRRRS